MSQTREDLALHGLRPLIGFGDLKRENNLLVNKEQIIEARRFQEPLKDIEDIFDIKDQVQHADIGSIKI